MSSAPRGPPRWAARTSCRRRTSAKPERSQFAEGARDVRAVRQAPDDRVERRVRRIRLGKAGESEAVPELSVEVLRGHRIATATAGMVHPEIGRAHVCTPVTNAQLVCRLLLEKKKHDPTYTSSTTREINQ